MSHMKELDFKKSKIAHLLYVHTVRVLRARLLVFSLFKKKSVVGYIVR